MVTKSRIRKSAGGKKRFIGRPTGLSSSRIGDEMAKLDVSGQALAILRSHGWHDERNVDISDVVTFLNRHGIEVPDVVADLLKSVHGLSLELTDGGLSAVKFDVYEEMSFLEDGELTYLEAIVGASLCPVGLGGRFLLFMTTDGEMVFLHDEWILYLKAKNVRDALEVICTPLFKEYDTVTLSDEQKPAAFRESL